jgi:hypothetical protein
MRFGTGETTERAALDKAQQHLVVAGQIEAIAGDGFAVWVLLGHAFLDQAQGFTLRPRV